MRDLYKPAKFRFRTSTVLVVLFVLLTGVSQLVSFWVSKDMLQSATKAHERVTIKSVGEVVDGLINLEVEKIRETAKLLAYNRGLPEALQMQPDKRNEALHSILDELYAISSVDFLEVTDDSEVVLYRAHDPGKRGNVSSIWGVSEALGGRSMLASFLDPKGVVICGIEPLSADGEVSGALVAGVELNKQFIRELSDNVGVDLVLLTRSGKTIASSLDALATVDNDTVMEAFHTKIPIYQDDPEKHYTYVYLPLMIVDEAFVVLARLDTSQSAALLQENLRRSAFNTLYILAGSIFLAILVLRYVLRPLRNLRSFAEEAAIKFTGEGIQTQYKDEVADVAYFLRILTNRLIHRNQDLAEAMNDGLWDWDVISGTLLLSPRYFIMLGYRPNEFESSYESWLNLIHPDDLESVNSAVAACLDGLEFFEVEFRMQAKSGQWRHILGRGRIVETDESGHPKRVLGTHMDITDRKRSELALRQSEKKFSSLFMLSPDSIVLTDMETMTVIDVNQAFTRLTGYSREEVLGRTAEEIGFYVDRTRLEDFIEEVGRHGLVDRMAVELTRRDGSIRTCSFSGSIIRLGGDYYMITIIRDITEIKKANDELSAAKERAEAASHAKSEFLANMSHEIRTPLNGILGILQLMQITELDNEQKEYVHIAIQSSQRLTRLLSDILDLSQVEAGKLEIRYEPFDVSGTVNEVCELFESASRQSDVRLKSHVDPSIPDTLMGDASRLYQVLNNFMGNAFKYTSQGEVTLEAYPIPATKPDTYRILFSVSDTGIGISDDKLEKLFKPFTQASEGFSRQYQGAGLGLSICKHLIELLGGNISIVSELEKGTTIYFTLDFGLPEESEDRAGQEEAVPKSAMTPVNVLVVEDDYISGFSARKMLEQNGCSVTVVEDGEQALQAMSRERFHIVLMDVQMPVMDGVEATLSIRQGRAGDDNNDIPIIGMTAYAMTGDKEKFLAAGMNDYLAKPLEMVHLQNMIEKWIH